MPIIPSVEYLTLKTGPRLIKPIVLKHASNFRLFPANQD